MPLPPFHPVARQRPADLLAPGYVDLDASVAGGEAPLPQPAPYVALTADLGGGPARVTLRSGRFSLTARWDGRGVADLEVVDAAGTETLRSRRRGRLTSPPASLALTLTGTHGTAFTRGPDGWSARARVDLAERAAPVETRTPDFLGGLTAQWSGVEHIRGGAFGQLGLRDLRFVTHRDGRAVADADGLLLTASHAGPGFFDTAHTGVWSFDPATLRLAHRGDLFFRRPGSAHVYGDHSTHLVRDGSRWLVATSTWGDFTPPRRSDRRQRVTVQLGESGEDLTRGRHVVDTRRLALPTDGLTSVAVWDPHLVHTGEEWLVGFVTASRFFRFHPALAGGPSLDSLELRSAATDRTATEGTTLLHLDGRWQVVASDGRDGPRGRRARFPVFDLALRETGRLDAPYPSNLPWPNLTRLEDGSWLMVTFDGTPWEEGSILGYGTHGDVVVLSTR